MSQWDEAVALARRYLPGADIVHTTVQSYRTVRDALENLEQAEQEVERAKAKLHTLVQRQIATDVDFDNFDALRTNLFSAQFQLYVIITTAASASLPEVVATRVLQELPPPRMSPAPRRPRRLLRLDPLRRQKFKTVRGLATGSATARASESVSLSGLGAAPAAGAAALLSNPIFWAATALVVLASVALLAYALYSASQAIASIVVTRTQGQMYNQMVDARLRSYEACMSRGGTRNECLSAVGLLVPTPEEAGVSPESPYGADPYKWIVWTVVGGSVAAGLFFFFRSDTGKMLIQKVTQRTLGRSPRRRNLGRGPRRVANLDGPSTYNLEIER